MLHIIGIVITFAVIYLLMLKSWQLEAEYNRLVKNRLRREANAKKKESLHKPKEVPATKFNGFAKRHQ
jgi:hypothetical protein